MRKWRIEDSEDLYNVKGWGGSYFSINEKGHMVVTNWLTSCRSAMSRLPC